MSHILDDDTLCHEAVYPGFCGNMMPCEDHQRHRGLCSRCYTMQELQPDTTVCDHCQCVGGPMYEAEDEWLSEWLDDESMSEEA